MAASSGFGIEHLPYGVVGRGGAEPRPAVRIGDAALELVPVASAGLLEGAGPGLEGREQELAALERPNLNGLLELGPAAWSGLRARLTELLDEGDTRLSDAGLGPAPLDELETVLPIEVGDYVDFYSSREHATNVGRLIRPEGEPLYPNWRHLPVGYHGRSATVIVSGTPVRRPIAQRPPEGPDVGPTLGPERWLDFELELGFVTGPGPAGGGPISTAEARERIFGVCLVNDWSARQTQAWEYQPLGPFLSKSFATSLAPWITPLEALEPFRVPGPEQDPEPLDYLRASEPRALDLALEVALVPAGSTSEQVISRSNAAWLYWSPEQQLAHATVNGAAIRGGDLFASGTISGFEPGTQGCLLELTRAGQEPMALGEGVERGFLEDGDEVILRGSAGGGAIALAEVRGRIEAAA